MARPRDTAFHRTLPLSTDLDLRRGFMVINEPLVGNVRFGRLLEVLDKMAEETALNYVRQFYPEARVVTAAIDEIMIMGAADVTRDIVLHARINHIGHTSMEVGIRVEHPGDPGVYIASCFFTMVARLGVGAQSKSVAIPALEYLDELEQRHFDNAINSRKAYRTEREMAQEPPSREEYELLNRLHAAQEQPEFNGLLSANLVADSWERMYPAKENVPTTIFGGYLMRRAYELSSICAELVAPNRPVIVAVNRVNFFTPVNLGDKLHYTCRVIYTGETSVCVEANICRISRDRTSQALSNSCLFTFVNVDENLVPQPVPTIYPTTYGEDALYLQAYRRSKNIGRHQH
ncbi:MAG: acyl-CoA thioesterase [Desulfuromonas sp.]|jgi:acyl-CoA hydrolase|nr:acyl-CoA thioesterase [Desulfuromonas sp.]